MIAPENTEVNFDFTNKEPYIQYSTNSNQTTGQTTQNAQTAFADSGYQVTATAHFKDDYIVLKVSISAKEITSHTPKDNLPVEADRTITSEIKCKNGDPIILGGMVQSTENNSKVTVPILSKLPIVGSLFTNKIKSVEQFENVMVITPTIMDIE